MTLEKTNSRQKSESQNIEMNKVFNILNAKPMKDTTPETPFKMPKNDKVLYDRFGNPINEDKCG